MKLSSFALHLISVHQESVSGLAETLQSEAGGRDQFLRHNQVKRWMSSCMKWADSGISFTVNMTEKPPVRSDIWSCVAYVADARAMNARQFLLSYVLTYRNKSTSVACFLCKYLVCGNNRSYSYRKTGLCTWCNGRDQTGVANYLTADGNFSMHKHSTD
jgi:hypothetical protein